MTTTVEYTCTDGTPFPVQFDSEAMAAAQWVREREHSPDPLTPLAEEISRLGQPGAQRVYDQFDLVMPGAFKPGPRANGFVYASEQAMAGDEMAKMVEGLRRLLAEHGTTLAVWHDRCLPETREAVASLESADESVSLAELAEHEAYGQQMTMIPAYICGNDLRLLTDACAGLFGDAADLIGYELTQGHASATLDADERLWGIARGATNSPAIMDALAAAEPSSRLAELRASAAEPAFFAAVDGFLAEFGRRAEGWDIGRPTWGEQGDGFWKQLAQMARPDTPEPSSTITDGARRREALAADISGRLADDPDGQAKFLRRYERAADYVAIREERALWQLILRGSLRHALLRRGEAMVDAGFLGTPADILYVLPDEIGAPTAGLGELAQQRRAEHERWLAKTPPTTIGGHAPRDAAAPAIGSSHIVRGRAASRGVATGRARVITDLADADHLEPGDVLVCVMTSPPWTPLFGIVSALVVDSGDLGSHPAIAAREYGIPCVLGTGVATAVIPDGATVTVDGEQGTVEVIGGL